MMSKQHALDKTNADKAASLDEAALSFEKLWCDSYDSDVPRSYIARHKTIKESILSLLEDDKADLPLIYFDGKSVTRKEANAQACRLGNALLSAGLQKGDRVSIVVSNRTENFLSFMACYKTGFIAAAYNQRCTEREILHSVAGVGSSALIIEKDTLPKIIPDVLACALPCLKVIVVLDVCSNKEAHMLFESEEGLANGEGLEAEEGLALPATLQIVAFDEFLQNSIDIEPDIDVKPDDGAILLFTGGTTGVSKGCCQTHERMVLELESMHAWCALSLKTPNPCFLVCMPMTHIMGINYGVNWQLINGACVAIAKGSKPSDILGALDEYKPQAWATLPTLLHSLTCEKDLASTPYKNLELVIFGGSFISLDTLNNLSSKTNAAFVESYGMSESFGFVTCNPVKSGGKLGSIGLPLCNTDVLIVDVETGTQVMEAGKCGEIIFRGPQIISQYWNNPEETALALRDGWLYSGDIGYMDRKGYFYLVDRKKDTIVVSGFNVFPKEIDELLVAHPDILDACTVGVPDKHSGERPQSFIVQRNGANLTKDQIIAYCKEYLVAYKAPKYVAFLKEIPKTKAKKPDRELLRNWAKEALLEAEKQSE